MKVSGSGRRKASVADRYRTWVMDRVGVADEGRDRVLVLPEPTASISEISKSARDAGAERIICGFLPDEVEWNGADLDETGPGFLNQCEFVPWLLPETTFEAKPENDFVLYLASDPVAEISRDSRTLACAWSDAMEVPLREVRADELDTGDLVRALWEARLIVNNASDWLLAFAVDFWGASTGRQVMRIGHPGYSPLRYGLLGDMLRPRSPFDPPRVRDLSRSSSLSHDDRDAMRQWFAGPRATELWRRMFDVRAFTQFWATTNFREGGDDAGFCGTPWLDRPMAWAGLHAALCDPTYPRWAGDKGVATMTRWYLHDRRSRAGGNLRERAAPRWLRRHPTWLHTLGQHGSSMPQLPQLLAHLAKAALAQIDRAAPGIDLLRTIPSSRIKDPALTSHAAFALAWSDNWAAVAATVPNPKLPAEWRSVCAEACAGGLARSTAAPDGRRKWERDAALIESESHWLNSLGPVAPLIRVWGAVRAGAVPAARRAWRQAAFPGSGGLAGIARAAFSDERELSAWLARTAGRSLRCSAELLVMLVDQWFCQHCAEIWAHPPIGARRHEANSAMRALELTAKTLVSPGPALDVLARLCAACGRSEQAVAAASAFAQVNGGKGGYTTPAVSIYLMQRGAGDASRAVMQAWPDPEETSAPVLLLRALAAQVTGLYDEAERCLSRIGVLEPGFLKDIAARDWRWTPAAIGCARAGLRKESRRLREIAGLSDDPNRYLLELCERQPEGDARLAAAWRALIAW